MIPWVALDMLHGRAVRLREGRREEVTNYGPVEDVLTRWMDAGVRHIHAVDLGGAFGEPGILASFMEAWRTRFPGAVFQVAGGIRSAEAAMRLAEAGADRIVLGSMLFEDSPSAARLVEALGGARCIAALDVREGRVRMKGWTRDAGLPLKAALELARSLGFEEVLVTDIARDGGMAGPNLSLYQEFAASGLGIIASGGIACRGDLAALAAMPGVTGAIVGKALYEGRLSLKDLLEAAP